MANAKSTIVTIQGLNNCHAYGLAGSHFSIKYFLPVYDPSIDNLVHSSTQALTSGTGQDVQILSATMSVSDTEFTFQGERLFNANSSIVQTAAGVGTASEVYTLSESDQYIITSAFGVSGGAGHTGAAEVTLGPSGSIINSSQNVPGRINLVGNATSAISVAFSATDNFTVSGACAFSGDVSVVPQYPEPTYSHRNMLYPVKSFAPVDLSANTPTVDAGRYHVTLEANVGSFKFNKIVFFLAKMNADGSEDTSVLPTIFGETVFEGTQIKTKDQNQTGGTNLVWDGVVDLIFERSNINDNLTYLQWDNWSFLSSAFGLATGNKVSIFDSSGSPSSWEPNARLHITDSSVDQLRLANNANNYSTLNVTSAGDLNISATNSIVIPQPDSGFPASVPPPDTSTIGKNPLVLSAGADHTLNIWPNSSLSYSISADGSGTSLELNAETLYLNPTVRTEARSEFWIRDGLEIHRDSDSNYGLIDATSTGDLLLSATNSVVIKQPDSGFPASLPTPDVTTVGSTPLVLSGGIDHTLNIWPSSSLSYALSAAGSGISLELIAANNIYITPGVSLEISGDTNVIGDTEMQGSLIVQPSVDIKKSQTVHGGTVSRLSIHTYSEEQGHVNRLELFKSSAANVDNISETASGEQLGEIRWYGVNTGNAFARGAEILATQSNAAGASSVPTYLNLRVWDDSDAIFTFLLSGEKKTITSSLPTSTAGLSTGDWWNDSGTVKIVP